MILPPLNDHACLGSITDVVRGLVTERDATLVALAATLGVLCRPSLVIQLDAAETLTFVSGRWWST